MTSQERKRKTEAVLKNLKIDINPSLPCIEEEEDANIRDGKDIAKRILVLIYLNILKDGGSKEIIQFLKDEHIWDSVSKNEEALFNKDILTKKEQINISWRSEAIWILLWAINKIERLDLPIQECEVSEIMQRVPKFLEPTKTFVNNASTRSLSEILDISDLIYRLHWASRNSELGTDSNPIDLNSGILQEWHYAINWVTYYNDDWDEITTDT